MRSGVVHQAAYEVVYRRVFLVILLVCVALVAEIGEPAAGRLVLCPERAFTYAVKKARVYGRYRRRNEFLQEIPALLRAVQATSCRSVEASVCGLLRTFEYCGGPHRISPELKHMIFFVSNSRAYGIGADIKSYKVFVIHNEVPFTRRMSVYSE